VAAASGSICVGTVPALAIGLYKNGLEPTSLLFWRYWLALSLLVPLAVFTSPGLGEEWRRAGRGLFLNSITLGAVQTFTYFRAIETIPSSIAVTIFFAYPIFTVLLDQIIYGRKARWPTLLAVLLIFIGVMQTGWPHLRLEGLETVGLACAALTPLVFSIYIAIAYRLTREASPFAGATFIYLGLGCGFALVAAVMGLRFPINLEGWGRLVTIAVVGGVLQISAFAYALPRLSASGYSIVVSLELVTVALLGVALLGEHLSTIQTAGILLVITGIVVERMLRAG
jgi:drug/metabolite transporter (DMT)-like permease